MLKACFGKSGGQADQTAVDPRILIKLNHIKASLSINKFKALIMSGNTSSKANSVSEYMFGICLTKTFNFILYLNLCNFIPCIKKGIDSKN